MSEDKCKAQYIRETQIFWEFVHMDGVKAYTWMVSKIKDISLVFVDDQEGACVPAEVRSITKRTGQHFKENVSVQHHVQMRFDPYLNVDKGWDDSTEELVTDIFNLAGDASRMLSEMHFRIAILRSKVRLEIFIKIINAFPLPNTDITVIKRAEPEIGLNGDKERIQYHMPRPDRIDGTDKPTNFLGALVHWVMRNNLLTVLDFYTKVSLAAWRVPLQETGTGEG